MALALVISASYGGFCVKIKLGTHEESNAMKWEEECVDSLGIWQSTWGENRSVDDAENHYRKWADNVANWGWKWSSDANLM